MESSTNLECERFAIIEGIPHYQSSDVLLEGQWNPLPMTERSAHVLTIQFVISAEKYLINWAYDCNDMWIPLQMSSFAFTDKNFARYLFLNTAQRNYAILSESFNDLCLLLRIGKSTEMPNSSGVNPVLRRPLNNIKVCPKRDAGPVIWKQVYAEVNTFGSMHMKHMEV